MYFGYWTCSYHGSKSSLFSSLWPYNPDNKISALYMISGNHTIIFLMSVHGRIAILLLLMISAPVLRCTNTQRGRETRFVLWYTFVRLWMTAKADRSELQQNMSLWFSRWRSHTSVRVSTLFWKIQILRDNFPSVHSWRSIVLSHLQVYQKKKKGLDIVNRRFQCSWPTDSDWTIGSKGKSCTSEPRWNSSAGNQSHTDFTQGTRLGLIFLKSGKEMPTISTE